MATSRGNMNHSIQLQQNHHLHHHQNQQKQQQQQEHNQHHHQNQIPYAMMQSSSIPGNFISKDTGAYDLGELDQTLFLYLDGQDPSTVQDQRLNSGMRPPTLNIFPSQPMHVEPPSSSSTKFKRPSEPSMELANPKTDASSSDPNHSAKAVKRDGNGKGPTSSSEQEGPKTPDPKTLRRLAQNREAARKSRLRKKAYVQQLESSRIRLTQLEQELQRARTQGMFFGGGNILGGEQGLPVGINNISSDAAVFDMEYARWVEEHHRLMCELRAAVQEHLAENELRMFVDNCLAHFDEMMSLKGMVAKTDVFHIVSGMWKTPAERCFMWIGGFRPSDLIKVIVNHIEPLTEQQIMGICGLQQSTQEAEEALSQGLEALNHSLSDIITSDSLSCPPNMTNYMGQMAIAINKLSTLEGFVGQADNLRHQTMQRLHQILTTRQAARCLLAIAEYFHRLRALSSLWLARPRQEQ
ncbi:TGACG-sequence-specific DNA-binding protein TGA-2.1 [Hibiscus syriacus]|uniref:TGACG-sequence-specific DNA-binding protein TGA-2.1 n=1 Tax=Hibiscus syriacus TaxID=106335 RepID=A0A6A2ZRX3_HIBSY|nr:TGACG-sequence-specific DNA-binding protein TGA-2.1 [Hibiscus syriacus]